MKCDILVAGVGGQGVLSIAAIIASCAMKSGLRVKQSETHGMAQRGGAVLAHLRISDRPIHSDLIPEGTADMILAMEPIESLRYLSWLRPGGTLLTSTDPVRNVPDYPDLPRVMNHVRSLRGALLVETGRLAREAGSPKASNVVMVGAASEFLPFRPGSLEACIGEAFSRKGTAVVETNLKAFRAGRGAIQWASS
jgi:indolepyruvate ferredoxin oxidoreductase, beta subunit